MDLPGWTYQDIAMRLKVHPRVVSRWVNRLERSKRLRPFRPSKGTVRLSNADVHILLTLHFGRVPK